MRAERVKAEAVHSSRRRYHIGYLCSTSELGRYSLVLAFSWYSASLFNVRAVK